MLNPKIIKKQFPIFRTNKSLTYLDNASTTQKPKSVIDAIKFYYENFNANIHRGIYKISEEATEAYEKVRKQTSNFINAKFPQEIIFTRNTTEAINLVAYTWGETNVKKGNEIIVSALEHHSNLIPWQELCKRLSAKLLIIPLKNDYTLDIEKYKKLLSSKTKLVCISAMSNVLGTIPLVKEMAKEAHKKSALVLVDGAQSIAHLKTDVQNLDCDFFTFSAHKMFGPTGVGILYGKKHILENIPPFLFGGDMIKDVTQTSCKFNDIPWKFEAGTQNIADVIAFGEAIKFIEKIGFKNIQAHDQELLSYTKEKFSKYKNVKLLLPSNLKNTGPVISFIVKGLHPHDIASIFDEEGIAIRAGYHCAKPLMDILKIPATSRISFSVYNTKEDIDAAEKALKKVFKIFKI